MKEVIIYFLAQLAAPVVERLSHVTDHVKFALDSLVSHRIIQLSDVTLELVNLIIDHNCEWHVLSACDRLHKYYSFHTYLLTKNEFIFIVF